MSLIHAIILGIVQGITEFFPVSSSAHLQLARRLFGLGEPSVLFDLSCHLGTLLALLLFFRKEILSLLRFERARLFPLFIALLPLFPAYFLLKPLRDWAGQPHLLGYFLLLTAAILLIGERLRLNFNKKNSPMRDALFIGSMQAMALIPGISRSASTISAARVIGWQVSDAVRFSFLLSIPAVLGGTFLEGLKAMKHANTLEIAPCAIGGVVAFCVGFGAIRLAMKWLERGRFRPFAFYCLLLGSLVILFR